MYLVINKERYPHNKTRNGANDRSNTYATYAVTDTDIINRIGEMQEQFVILCCGSTVSVVTWTIER